MNTALPPNIDDLCKIPGMEGCAWRLVKLWNPEMIARWMQIERLRGTPGPLCADALGDVLAAAAMGFGENCAPDVKEAIIGSMGVVPAFQRHLQKRINEHRGRTEPSRMTIIGGATG
jgi:hypothetical protein